MGQTMPALTKLFEPAVTADDEGEYSFDEISARAQCPIPNGPVVDLEAAFHTDFPEVAKANEPKRLAIAKRIAARRAVQPS